MFLDRFVSCDTIEKAAFTDTVNLLGGGTPKTDVAIYWNGNIPFFTPKDANSSAYCISTEKHLSREGLNNCSSRLFPKNTTFVTCRGTVGNLALAGEPMAMNQSCYAIQGKEGYPPLFVFAFSRFVISTMKKQAIGAVFSALVTRDFEMEETIKPDKAEALQFNKDIEPLFAQIFDNTIEIRKLENMLQLLLMKLSSR